MSLEDYRPQVWQPLWKPKDSQIDAKPSVAKCSPLPAGCCEFAGALIWEGATGRYCRLSGCCFLFVDLAAYASCPSRTEKLREQKKA